MALDQADYWKLRAALLTAALCASERELVVQTHNLQCRAANDAAKAELARLGFDPSLEYQTDDVTLEVIPVK